MTIIFTLGMVAYGLKRGCIPAIRWFLVFSFSVAFALTFRDSFAPTLHGIFRKMDWAWIEALSYLIIQTFFFVLLTVPLLMYSQETVPVHKQVDRLIGLAFGAAAGLSLGGMLILSIMVLPSGRRIFTGRTDWYVPPHQLMLRAYGFLSRGSIGGERRFVEDVVIRDLERGRPSMPASGERLWVSSVPVGLRVYLIQGYASRQPITWKRVLENQLYKLESPWRQTGTGRRRRRAEGYIGRTPVSVEIAVPEMIVAVEMPVPEDVPFDGQTQPFYWDGEVAWFTQTVFNEPVVIKMYRLHEPAGLRLMTLVAAFVPKDMSLDDRLEWYEKRLPGRNCFATYVNVEEAMDKLLTVATSREVDEHYLPQLLRGGKVVLEDPNTGQIIVYEVQSDKTLREMRRPAAAPEMKPLQ